LNKSSTRLIKIILISLVMAIMVAGLSGCGTKTKSPAPLSPVASPGSATAPTATKKAAASVPPKTSANAAAVKSATPLAVPKLNDIAYNLNLENGQEYTESTTSIFLRTNQVLHMNWLVIKGGNHFHLTFSLPNGDAIAVRTDGTLSAFTPTNDIPEELTKNGSLVFRPSDNDWEDGYYIFHSQITTGDSSVSIKLLYWIEG
jgi:hypothetical protein